MALRFHFSILLVSLYLVTAVPPHQITQQGTWYLYEVIKNPANSLKPASWIFHSLVRCVLLYEKEVNMCFFIKTIHQQSVPRDFIQLA